VLAGRTGDRHAQHVARALAFEAGLILAAAVIAAAIDVRAAAFFGDAVIALLALAMGIRNATVRRLGVPDLTTTVLTMTIAGREG
jgi:uncharacterized membrane protein YoaK (UPF0700 family)